MASRSHPGVGFWVILGLKGSLPLSGAAAGTSWVGDITTPASSAGKSHLLAGPVKRQVAVKSTRGFALKSTHGIAIKSTPLAAADKGESAGPVRRSTRQFYDGEENCYIIDAKLEGNLGRYLNVSRAEEGVRGGWGSPRAAKNGRIGEKSGFRRAMNLPE